MKISSPKCLHPKALSWFFRENIWQFGIVWEMPLTSVYNPPPPQNPSNTHLYSKTTPYWTKNILFYSIQRLKWTKSGISGILTHIPQFEESGESTSLSSPRKIPYPPRGGYASYTHKIRIFPDRKTSKINTFFSKKRSGNTCIIQRKWVTLQRKGKQEGGGAQQPESGPIQRETTQKLI